MGKKVRRNRKKKGTYEPHLVKDRIIQRRNTKITNDTPLEILYKGNDFLIINKPFDITLYEHQPVTVTKMLRKQHKSLVDVKFRFPHRLDYVTSGVLIVGLTLEITAKLTKCFSNKNVKKEYLAVCYGHVEQKEFTINEPIEIIEPNQHGIRVRISKNGKPSETRGRVLKYAYFNGKPVTKVALSPITGRTHQLRIHMFHLGHPIVGDVTYIEDYDAPRMMLHANKLEMNFCDEIIKVETNDPFDEYLTEMQ